jgi:hypothetical protein
MPARSRILRTALPAMMPVPGAAGSRRTRVAPNSPSTACGIVEPSRQTRMICLRASLTDFSISFGTSRPLP